MMLKERDIPLEMTSARAAAKCEGLGAVELGPVWTGGGLGAAFCALLSHAPKRGASITARQKPKVLACF